jgi:hypothetical protein
MKRKTNILFVFFCFLFFSVGFSQELFISNSDPGVEKLLDELAMDHVIPLNSVVKPYFRAFVFSALKEASSKDSLLTKRVSKEVKFYLKNYINETAPHPPSPSPSGEGEKRGFSFDPLGFSLVGRGGSLSVRPLLGYTQFYNKHGAFYDASVGVGAFGYLGKHLGGALSIRKTFENCILSEPEYFTQSPGGNWNRYSNGGGDFVEWTGQLTYSWRWGSLGVYNDHFTWGDGYNGASYFSGRPPAFPFLKLHVKPAKWMEFSYIHAWLKNSDLDFSVVNESNQAILVSSNSKHVAANLLTIKPWKGLDISFGNSIVFDGSEQLAYFIPIFFYKSIDHTLSNIIDNENSQMFFNISSRQIRHLRLYLSLYIDEFKMSRVLTKDQHNFLSWKGGFNLSDWPVKNLSFIAEGIRTLPSTYQHYIPTITFASDGFNLGNYLRDNSQELYLALIYKPVSRLSLTLSYNFAEHGDEFQYGLVPDPTTLPVIKNISWSLNSVGVNVSYSILSGAVIFVDYCFRSTYGDVRFTPPVYLGNTNTFSTGLKIGF